MKTKYLLSFLVILLTLSGCTKIVNNWVYILSDVSAFPSLADSLRGAKIAVLMDKAAYASLRKKPYAQCYNESSLDESVGAACDELYAETKDTVTTTFTITVKKYFNSSDLTYKPSKTIRKYEYSGTPP